MTASFTTSEAHVGPADLRFQKRVCPLCSASESGHLFRDINRREGLRIAADLRRCLRCGILFVNPAPEEQDLARLYADGAIDPLHSAPLDEVTDTARPRPFIGRVLRLCNGVLRGHPHDWPKEPGDGRSILDFGCYTGEKLTRWLELGWHVAGIDLNRAAIDLARRRFPQGTFWCGDVRTLEIADRFDIIRTDNVVEHLLEPLSYLSALVRLLKPSGRLRVFVPNGRALSVRLFGRYSAVFWMPFHVNLFSVETLESLLKRAGLRHVDCRTFTPIGSWTWTQRQLLLRPGFNRRPPSSIDAMIRRCSLLNYPGESLSQWMRVGEELIATGTAPW